MRLHALFSLVAPLLLLLAACTQLETSAQVGYAQFALDGDIGFAAGSTSADIAQDVTAAFGLGDDQGIPYGRVAFDMGVPVVTVSGFGFEEQGTGTLTKNYGGSPFLAAGANVNSDFEMWNAKASLVFDISLGPVTISPGLAADYIDFSLQVREVTGLASETAELQAPVPIGLLRGAVDIQGVVTAFAEIGYMEADIDEVNGKLLDIEAMVTVHATSLLDLFVGYRLLGLDADGLIDNDTFVTDTTISGFVIGGGLRF